MGITGTAGEIGITISADAINKVAVKAGMIAKVLKCLGIAFADHVGGSVAVKHIDQLPGVRAIGADALVNSVVIICNK